MRPVAERPGRSGDEGSKAGVVAEQTHFLTQRVVGSLGVQTVPSSEDFRRSGRLSVRRRLPLWRLRLARRRRLWLWRLRNAACHGDVAASAKGTYFNPRAQ